MLTEELKSEIRPKQTASWCLLSVSEKEIAKVIPLRGAPSLTKLLRHESLFGLVLLALAFLVFVNIQGLGWLLLVALLVKLFSGFFGPVLFSTVPIGGTRIAPLHAVLPIPLRHAFWITVKEDLGRMPWTMIWTFLGCFLAFTFLVKLPLSHAIFPAFIPPWLFLAWLPLRWALLFTYGTSLRRTWPRRILVGACLFVASFWMILTVVLAVVFVVMLSMETPSFQSLGAALLVIFITCGLNSLVAWLTWTSLTRSWCDQMLSARPNQSAEI